ncbi:unnamed protein product [Cylicocyclus nassatus]|uniref:Uncharacterized protein n=1 Tax=Cylicocyclus nassatus TaxID=53992 RepID=A0AA36GU85_CYLNA|nr:unnamed protein product [Cylicocyclus nassatus]
MRLDTWYILTDRIYDRQVQATLMPRGRRFYWLETGSKQEYDVKAESVLKWFKELKFDWVDQVEQLEKGNKALKEKSQKQIECKQLDWSAQTEGTADGDRNEHKEQGSNRHEEKEQRKEKLPKQNDETMDWMASTHHKER